MTPTSSERSRAQIRRLGWLAAGTMVLVGLAWPGTILATPAGDGVRQPGAALNGILPSDSIDPSPAPASAPV